jgi:hypothetical protein
LIPGRTHAAAVAKFFAPEALGRNEITMWSAPEARCSPPNGVFSYKSRSVPRETQLFG